MANKAIEFAQNDKKLYDVIAQTVGMNLYKEENYVDALNWLFGLKHGNFVNHIAKTLVDEMMGMEIDDFLYKFDILSVRQEVRSSTALLSFIEQYTEYTKFVSGRNPITDYPEALKRLLKMIKDQVIPVEYMGKILIEFLPLIKEKIASTEELEVLMMALAGYEVELNRNKEVKEIRRVLSEAYQTAILNT